MACNMTPLAITVSDWVAGLDDKVRGSDPSGLLGGVSPNAPTSFSASYASDTSLDLTWVDNATIETGYEIDISLTGTGGWTNVTTTAANAISYTDTGLTVDTTYYYRIRALGATGDSAYATANATTTAPVPSTLLYTIPIPGSAIWWDPDYVGTESGTEAQPYSSIEDALADTTNGVGDHIVCKDGTYAVTSANREKFMFNDRVSSGFSLINSGASWATSETDRANMILIRAETAYGVRFNYTGTGGYYYGFINFEAAEYVSVDGFIFTYDATSGAALSSVCTSGSNNYISRCIVKRAAGDTHGSWFICGDNSLIEMCAGVGSTRYGFRCGSSSGATTNHCFRLCIGRQDFYEYNQPNATFAHYGNNGGYLSGHSTWLNCLAVDGQHDIDGSNFRYGSFYMLKDYDDISMRGCLVLNEGADFGSYTLSTGGSGRDMDAQHMVAWDTGEEWDGTGLANPAIRGNSTEFLTNDIDFVTAGNNGSNGLEYSGNNIQVGVNVRDNAVLNGTDKSILYQSDGADIRYVYGSLCQRYGDAGYNTVTTVAAYPWPNEATIKTVFTEQMNAPVGEFPPTNVSARGFCLATSLTDYLIKYEDGTTTIGEVYP